VPRFRCRCSSIPATSSRSILGDGQLPRSGECLTVEADRGRHQARKTRRRPAVRGPRRGGITPRRPSPNHETRLGGEGIRRLAAEPVHGDGWHAEVTENAAHIDDLISAHLQWLGRWNRLPAVDRAVLRGRGCGKLLHADDVPEPVRRRRGRGSWPRQLSTDDSPGVRQRAVLGSGDAGDPHRFGPPLRPCGGLTETL